MANTPLPPVDILRQLLDYDPKTGLLHWKTNFSARARKDERAFARKTEFGHLRGKMGGQYFYAHRIIWKMMKGYDPVGIDHIDGDPANNVIHNLREADHGDNGKNQSISARSKTGITGITLDRGKFRADITNEQTQIFLGRFDSLDDALWARRDAEKSLKFHPNHGTRPTRQKSGPLG